MFIRSRIRGIRTTVVVIAFGALGVLPLWAYSQQGRTTVDADAASGEATLQEERNKALVLRFYEEAWHNDNFTFADEFFSPDYIRHDASDPAQGAGGAPLQSEIARRAKRIMPDFRYARYDAVLAEGDLVAVRWTSQGTPVGFPGLMRRLVGKSGPMEVSGVNTYRTRDGRVVEIWNNRDDLAIMREMGIFRWYAAGGFLAGALVTLLATWAVRRRGERRRAPPVAAVT